MNETLRGTLASLWWTQDVFWIVSILATPLWWSHRHGVFCHSTLGQIQHCEFGASADLMWRDKNVFRMSDMQLLENPDLTQAVEICRAKSLTIAQAAAMAIENKRVDPRSCHGGSKQRKASAQKSLQQEILAKQKWQSHKRAIPATDGGVSTGLTQAQFFEELWWDWHSTLTFLRIRTQENFLLNREALVL